MRSIIIAVTIAAAALLLAACASKDHLDQVLEYEPLLNATVAESQRLDKIRAREQGLEKPPTAAPAKVEPIAPKYNPLDEIPISITMRGETLHNVLYVVARNAGLNLVIDPGISLDNTITISFVETPSSVVVTKLLKAYDLDWDVEDNTLFVKQYVERTFMLDFLNTKIEAELQNGGDIYGTLGGTGTGGLEGDFNMDASLGKGVEADSLYDFIKTSVDEIIQGGDTTASGSYFTLDPVAGTLVVKATPSKMERVAQLVTDVRTKLSKQVIIDARILQVTLSDQFRMGIQWNYVNSRLNALGFGVKWGDPTSNALGLDGNPSVVTDDAGSHILAQIARDTGGEVIGATIEALKNFGGVKTISNPHIRARHSQPALITSGTTQRYISEITATTDDNGNTTYATTTASAFTGIMLGVYPFINQNNDVDLLIFPIKSESDLSNTATINNNTITLPTTEVQNISTNIRVRDGATIILGGLIENSHTDSDAGVPGAMDVPLLGWLFKQKTRTEEIRELVIIMQIRVI